jgi:hypothetical protein
VRNLERKFEANKEETNRNIMQIQFNELPKKIDKIELEELDSILRSLLAQLEKKLDKYREECKKNAKARENVVYEMKEPKKLINDSIDEASLMKKPLMGFKLVGFYEVFLMCFFLLIQLLLFILVPGFRIKFLRKYRFSDAQYSG